MKCHSQVEHREVPQTLNPTLSDVKFNLNSGEINKIFSMIRLCIISQYDSPYLIT